MSLDVDDPAAPPRLSVGPENPVLAGPVGAGCALLREAIDVLQKVDLAMLAGPDVVAALDEVETQTRRIPTVRDALVAEAQTRGIAATAGYRSTGAWLRSRFRVGAGEARTWLRGAELLTPRRPVSGGEPLEPVLAATAAARAAGTLSAAQVRVIDDFCDDLPTRLAPPARRTAEAVMVDYARDVDPVELTRYGQRLLDRLDPDGTEPVAADAHRRRGITIGPLRRGLARISGHVDAWTREAILTVLTTLSDHTPPPPPEDQPGAAQPADEPSAGQPEPGGERRRDQSADEQPQDKPTAGQPKPSAGQPEPRAGQPEPGGGQPEHEPATEHPQDKPAAGQPGSQHPGYGPDADSCGAAQDSNSGSAADQRADASDQSGGCAGVGHAGARHGDGDGNPGHDHTSGDGCGPAGSPLQIDPDRRSYPQRLHDALREACERLISAGGLPRRGGTPATILLTVPLRALEKRTGLVSTAHGGDIPTAEVIRRAADATIIPIVLDDHGNPLQLGRTQRLANWAQRHALHVRDGGCVIPGCTTPSQDCHTHHLHDWARAGQTNIDNLTLLCPYHRVFRRRKVGSDVEARVC